MYVVYVGGFCQGFTEAYISLFLQLRTLLLLVMWCLLPILQEFNLGCCVGNWNSFCPSFILGIWGEIFHVGFIRVDFNLFMLLSLLMKWVSFVCFCWLVNLQILCFCPNVFFMLTAQAYMYGFFLNIPFSSPNLLTVICYLVTCYCCFRKW